MSIRPSWILLIVVVATSACSRQETGVSGKSDTSVKGPAQTPSVTTVRAISRDVSSTVQATGSYVAYESSDVAPQAAGIIVQTLVDVGDVVQQGQVIARLDDRDAKLKLDQAQAAQQQGEAFVRQAQSRIGLAQNQTFDANTVPEVLAAKAAYESAQAQWKLAQA